MSLIPKEILKALPPALVRHVYTVLAFFFLLCAGFWGAHFAFEDLLPAWANHYSFQLAMLFCVLLIFWKGWRPQLALRKTELVGVSLGLMAYFGLIVLFDLLLAKLWDSPVYEARSNPHFLIVGLALAPFFEELLFRDYVFRAIWLDSKNFWQAVLLSSLFFMFAHLSFHFGAFLLGLVTCMIYRYSRSVIPCIVFHFGSNALVYLMPTHFSGINDLMGRLNHLNWL